MRCRSIIRSLLTLSATAAQLVSSYDVNTPSDVTATICGDIVNSNLYDDQIWFYASDVLACLTSLPFLPDVGSRFIKWYNDTLSFHASTAYLKNPPASYQQPPVDVFAGLAAIQRKISAGQYKNHYAFEVDVQLLSQQTHDIHAVLWGGASGPWTYAAPFYLTTVSTDGRKTPKVYMQDDLANCATSGHTCSYSAIATINGIPVIDFLTDFAKRQSYGYVEPDADWQNLMWTPAQALLLAFNSFTGSATFYPGDELKITFENSTTYTDYWIALYNSPGFTGPLATAGDYYNFFVLGLAPANYDDTLDAYLNATASTDSSDNSTTAAPSNTTYTSWTSDISAYPQTLSHQANLGLYSSGFVTGYYLEDVRTAVLSIPSFDEYGDGIGTFSEAIGDFIGNATNKGAQKIIIDVQQNLGGQAALAYDVYRWFFPGKRPFAGSRRRAFHEANLIGDATTRRFNGLNTSSVQYASLSGSEWVATELLNAETGRNFSSWSQLYGPLRYNRDTFSRVQRYNLSSPLFNSNFLGVNFPSCFYNNTCDGGSWAGKDIIVLSDGLCTSACTLFVEMMVKDGGAHSVVVGGRPQSGPMQTASGSRGAALYSRGLVDADISSIARYNSTINTTLPLPSDSGMSVTFAGFTLRDQIRNGSSVPNQFHYLPADCRLYWSLANFNNYTRLWQDTYNGIFGDTSICVPESRNVTEPPKRHNTRAVGVFAELQTSKWILQGLGGDTKSNAASAGSSHGGVQDQSQQAGTGPLQECNPKKPNCAKGLKCEKIQWPCKKCNDQTCFSSESNERFICRPTCQISRGSPGECGEFFKCRADNTPVSNKGNAPSPSGTKKSGVKNPGTTPTAARSTCEANIGNGAEYCADVEYALCDLLGTCDL